MIKPNGFYKKNFFRKFVVKLRDVNTSIWRLYCTPLLWY